MSPHQLLGNIIYIEKISVDTIASATIVIVENILSLSPSGHFAIIISISDIVSDTCVIAVSSDL